MIPNEQMTRLLEQLRLLAPEGDVPEWTVEHVAAGQYCDAYSILRGVTPAGGTYKIQVTGADHVQVASALVHMQRGTLVLFEGLELALRQAEQLAVMQQQVVRLSGMVEELIQLHKVKK